MNVIDFFFSTLKSNKKNQSPCHYPLRFTTKTAYYKRVRLCLIFL